MVFALITESRKLRPYFQAHTILVLTDQPMKKEMNRPNVVGQMILWAVELGEFDIKYHPWTTIMAQALADFVAKFTLGAEDKVDEVFLTVKVDGSFNKKLEV